MTKAKGDRSGPTVVLTGSSLTLEEVVRVARHGTRVAVDAGAVDRMKRARGIVEATLQRGEPVYGLTTGVGVLKRIRLGTHGEDEVNRQIIHDHQVGHGPLAPTGVVRATMLRLANGLASGTPGVRAEVAQRLVGALNDNRVPPVRLLGSIGMADLAPLADLAAGVLADLPLAAGEGLALINNNSFATAYGTLAVHDTEILMNALDATGALSLEGFAGNPSTLEPFVAGTRPYFGLRQTVDRLRGLLEGSYLWQPGGPRNLQDPLTFRCLPQVHGACRDALAFVQGQVATELNASQGNPIIDASGGRILSVGNFDILPLAAALDYLRIALAPVLTSSAERVVKLLDTAWSGLPTGLVTRRGTAEAGLAMHAIAVQSLAAEARLLAQPVSFEVTSSSIAEGIEDRMTMAPLAARRLAEMVSLGQGIAATELVVAAQAVEVRGRTPLGRGTRRLLTLVRKRVPFMEQGAPGPKDLGPLRELVTSEALDL